MTDETGAPLRGRVAFHGGGMAVEAGGASRKARFNGNENGGETGAAMPTAMFEPPYRIDFVLSVSSKSNAYVHIRRPRAKTSEKSSSVLPTQSVAWKNVGMESKNPPPKGRLAMQAHKDHSRRVILTIGVAATLVALLTAHHEKLVPPSPEAALRQAAVQDAAPPVH